MFKTITTILTVASALLMTGTAFADNTSADNAVNERANKAVMPAAQTQQIIPVRYELKQPETKTAKRKVRVVTQPLARKRQATRTTTQGRFVIGTDNSRDAMVVFNTAKHSKAMPNLFAN